MSQQVLSLSLSDSHFLTKAIQQRHVHFTQNILSPCVIPAHTFIYTHLHILSAYRQSKLSAIVDAIKEILLHILHYPFIPRIMKASIPPQIVVSLTIHSFIRCKITCD